MFRQIALGLLVSSVLLIGLSSNTYTYAEKCEDIKYDGDPLKMPGKDHDDNNPSEKKFEKMVFGSATLCEIAFCYDNDECKGELDSSDHDDFQTTIAYEGASEDQQDCLKYRYNLPDGGEKALQAYELYDCAVGNY